MAGSRWVWVGALTVAWLGGGWLLATFVGTLLDGRPAAMAAGTAVGVAAIALVLIPLALAVQGRRLAAARGSTLGFGPVAALASSLAAIGALVVVQTSTPGGLAGLWEDRRTWLFDAITQRGPFGSAAIPAVTARAAELGAPVPVDRARELLCDEARAGLAAAIVDAARAPGDGLPAPQGAVLDRILARAAVDPGGALLGAVDAAAATLGDAPIPTILEGALTPGAATRTHLSFTTADGAAVQALHDGVSWRICPPAESVAAAGAAWVRAAAEAATARLPAGPDADQLAAREVLRSVVAARSAWALGVPAVPGFGSALSPGLAAAEAERIRGWCQALAAGNPDLVPPLAALAVRWEVPGRLPVEGRAYLAETEAACAGVAASRVLVDGARGIPGGSDDRRRWSKLDGEDAAARAQWTPDGNGLRAVVPVAESGAGPTFLLVREGPGWVVAEIR